MLRCKLSALDRGTPVAKAATIIVSNLSLVSLETIVIYRNNCSIRSKYIKFRMV